MAFAWVQVYKPMDSHLCAGQFEFGDLDGGLPLSQTVRTALVFMVDDVTHEQHKRSWRSQSCKKNNSS
jgi:hypothetical protein